MKYYLFQGRVDKMDDRTFKELRKIEPTLEELTKEDYENRMGIGPKGSGSKKGKDVGQGLGNSQSIADQPQDQTDRTKKELIEELKLRGFNPTILNRKNKSQLIEMI